MLYIYNSNFYSPDLREPEHLPVCQHVEQPAAVRRTFGPFVHPEVPAANSRPLQAVAPREAGLVLPVSGQRPVRNPLDTFVFASGHVGTRIGKIFIFIFRKHFKLTTNELNSL